MYIYINCRLVDRVDVIESSFDEIHKKCDVIIARLDSFRVMLPPNYAEQANENDLNLHNT